MPLEKRTEQSPHAVRGPDSGGLLPTVCWKPLSLWSHCIAPTQEGQKRGKCLYSNTVFYQENPSGGCCVYLCTGVCMHVYRCVHMGRTCLCVCGMCMYRK